MKALLASSLLIVSLTGCGERNPESSADRAAAQMSRSIGPWVVRISTQSSAAPGFTVTPGEIRRSPEGNLFEHDIVFENRGQTRILLFNPRAAIGLLKTPDGEPRLIASGGWCGYESIRQATRGAAICILPAETMALRPGESRVLALAVSGGLRGLKPVVSGLYVLDLAFQTKRGRPPSRPAGLERVNVRIRYAFEPG